MIWLFEVSSVLYQCFAVVARCRTSLRLWFVEEGGGADNATIPVCAHALTGNATSASTGHVSPIKDSRSIVIGADDVDVEHPPGAKPKPDVSRLPSGFTGGAAGAAKLAMVRTSMDNLLQSKIAISVLAHRAVLNSDSLVLPAVI